jgi:DNA-directed RNA polymerase subunit beta'
VVVGRLVPAGTGLTYHKQRREAREVIGETTVSASDIEAALSEALNSSDE